MRKREVKIHFVLLLRIRLKPRSNGHKRGRHTETRSNAVQISIEYSVLIKVIDSVSSKKQEVLTIRSVYVKRLVHSAVYSISQ